MSRQAIIMGTLLFVGSLVVVADLAWNTAVGTTGPWFSPAVSRDVYTTTMIGGIVILAVLGAIASTQAASASRESRALDMRLNILRGSGVVVSGSGGSGIDIDRDIEDTLEEILGGTTASAAPVVMMDRDAHDSLVSVTTEIRGPHQEVVLREVARTRAVLQGAGARIWSAIAGPLGAAVLFLGIAGSMLPGAEGFAETHYVLNTAMILFLAYGWPFLAGWVAIGLGFARAQETKRAAETKAT